MNRLLLCGLVCVCACKEAGGSSSPDEQAPAADLEALPTEYPGTLVEIGNVERDFLMRQKIDGSWREMKFSFEAVIQKQGDALTVIGMTPFGTKAFVLEQTGTEVKFEKFVDRDMPFPPEYILQDINRAFLYDAELPWGLEGQPGTNEAVVHEETVHDEFVAGKLGSRTFVRASGYPAGTIRVEYADGAEGGVPPRKVLFENGWFGYRLAIKTIQYQAL